MKRLNDVKLENFQFVDVYLKYVGTVPVFYYPQAEDTGVKIIRENDAAYAPIPATLKLDHADLTYITTVGNFMTAMKGVIYHDNINKIYIMTKDLSPLLIDNDYIGEDEVEVEYFVIGTPESVTYTLDRTNEPHVTPVDTPVVADCSFKMLRMPAEGSFGTFTDGFNTNNGYIEQPSTFTAGVLDVTPIFNNVSCMPQILLSNIDKRKLESVSIKNRVYPSNLYIKLPF